MTIKQTLQICTNKFSQAELPSPRLDAEVLLGYITKKTREFIYTYPDKRLTRKQQTALNKIIVQRAKGLPVAYLTSHKEFFGLDFFVNRDVLIPRPETELLIEEALQLLKKNKKKTIADIGTGSGCIAISLAKALSSRAKAHGNWNIYASDISRAAIRVAKKNARHHRILKKIRFFHGDLLAPFYGKKTDIIIANLPYLPNDRPINSPLSRSLRYEPRKALFAGGQGLDIYQRFFRQLKNLKLRPTDILIEISPEQTTRIRKMITNLFRQAKIKIIKDLAGKNRIIKISLPRRAE